MSDCEDGRTCRRAETLVDKLVACTGARPTDRVMIAGCQHLDLLIALVRRGFDRAACRAAGPQTAEPVDLVIIPELCSEAELRRVLPRAGGALRQGGLVVFEAAVPLSAYRLDRVLAASGFGPPAVAAAARRLFYARRVAPSPAAVRARAA